MEAPKQARRHHTHKKDAQTHGDDVIEGVRIEMANAGDQDVGDREVRKPPQHIYRGRRKALAWRLGERALKGPPRHAADEMRDAVRKKDAPEQVG